MTGTRLAGRIALVTGASKGIGRAVAKRYALEGATVITIARNKKELLSLDDEITEATGQSAVLVDEDLTKYATIDQVGEALFKRYGKLDVVVGAAGMLGQLSPIGHQGQPHRPRPRAQRTPHQSVSRRRPGNFEITRRHNQRVR